jgi:hypothetical protein
VGGRRRWEKRIYICSPGGQGCTSDSTYPKNTLENEHKYIQWSPSVALPVEEQCIESQENQIKVGARKANILPLPYQISIHIIQHQPGMQQGDLIEHISERT